jgi:hypothetical protein
MAVELRNGLPRTGLTELAVADGNRVKPADQKKGPHGALTPLQESGF